MHNLTISPIRAFSDNYIWLIVRGNQGFVVDPGEAPPVTKALRDLGVQLAGILVTHHHFDHTGAVADLQQATGCLIWGPKNSPAGPYEHMLGEGDTVSILGERFTVFEVPGHTVDHIAYYSADQEALFCGDTLVFCRPPTLPYGVPGTARGARSPAAPLMRRVAALAARRG